MQIANDLAWQELRIRYDGIALDLPSFILVQKAFEGLIASALGGSLIAINRGNLNLDTAVVGALFSGRYDAEAWHTTWTKDYIRARTSQQRTFSTLVLDGVSPDFERGVLRRGGTPDSSMSRYVDITPVSLSVGSLDEVLRVSVDQLLAIASNPDVRAVLMNLTSNVIWSVGGRAQSLRLTQQAKNRLLNLGLFASETTAQEQMIVSSSSLVKEIASAVRRVNDGRACELELEATSGGQTIRVSLRLSAKAEDFEISKD